MLSTTETRLGEVNQQQRDPQTVVQVDLVEQPGDWREVRLKQGDDTIWISLLYVSRLIDLLAKAIDN